MNSTQAHTSHGVQDASLGDILRDTKGLSTEAVQQILAHQRAHGGRFGDAAVALGLVRQEDIVWALSQQFHYPFTRRVGCRQCAVQ
jgi:protein-tyrosine kinase